jgi:multicomponent Na+:H+ antiporter subunit G
LREVLIDVFLLTGATLSLIAAVGLHRLSNAYQRLHAATIPATSGLALTLTAAIMTHGTHGTEIFTLLFVLLTSPVGTHMMTKAMYEIGYRPWETDGRGRSRRRSDRR